MKIAEVMTRDVRVIRPDRSVRDAARIMDEMKSACSRFATGAVSSA
jgi:CBS domain-containing protein